MFRFLPRDLLKWPPSFRSGYLLLLLAVLVSLPLSKYVASASQILLLILWVAEGGWKKKWELFRNRPAIWIFLTLFFLHLAGLLWSHDLAYGWHDIKIKLPLLILPLVLGTIEPMDEREKRFLLGGFVVAVLVSALAGLLVLMGWVPYEMSSYRDASLFISHIRFALLIDLAVFILFYYAFESGLSTRQRILILLPALFMTGFLLLLKSITGLVVLILGGWLLALRWTIKQSDMMLKWFLVVGLVTAPLLVALYLSTQVSQFYTVYDNLTDSARVTVNGNPYWHDTLNTQLENGHLVGLYICETELRDAWNRVSSHDYDGLDKKGQEIRYTLRRYLTSLGYRKDSVGVTRLDQEDILLIERGYANSRYREPNRFSNRIYEIIWEIDVYQKGGNPSGHSVTQRLEYLKAGWAIFSKNPVLGVGTGDVQQAFQKQYEEMQSRLHPDWRLRTHNQFLTFMLTFGISGMILILLALILPPVLEKRLGSYFFLMFILVGLLSMLNEDTLETQAGVAFFAFFYSFFTFFDGRK